MAQFDIKRYEANKKRATVVRELWALPLSVKKNILQIIGIEGNRSDYFRTCITCGHWGNDICSKYNVLPPPKIIADGCETYQDYQELDIPF